MSTEEEKPNPRLGIARTLARDGLEETFAALPFPALASPDERLMEDVMVARLFPSRAAPAKIGRFTVRGRLGAGGMGVVYAAYDPELEREVAIKLLLGAASTPGDEERLRREARAMARVAHPNVARVIEIGAHERRTYVVLELLEGVTLDRWAEQRRPWREALAVYVQAGRGLAAAHEAGVVHRDFKPHNAMLVTGGGDEGRVKVLDFGLARAGVEAPPTATDDGSAQPDAIALTRTGALLGTPAYMSPEQYLGGQATERSDQYSFAASLYEALYGQLPHEGESFAALCRAVVEEPVRPPPRTEAPAWVWRIVARGLARDPAERFPSVAAMCDALERDPTARRRRLLVALGLSAAIGAGGFWIARASSTRPEPCAGPAFSLESAWDDGRQAAIAGAFSATGRRYAADTSRRVTAELDAYARDWTTQRVAACEAHQQGAESDARYDQRAACLDRRRASFEALTRVFASADASVLERAAGAVAGLPRLAACGDPEALRAETPPPDDPDSAREVERLRRELAASESLALAGRLDDALKRTDAALSGARTLAYAPVIAEASLREGAIHLELGHGQEAEASLTEAIEGGITARADRVAAEGLARRMFVRAELLQDVARAQLDVPLARSFAERFQGDGALQWLYLNNLGVVHHDAGDLERARALYEQAAAIDAGPTELERAFTRLNIGLVEIERGELAAASATMDQARASIEEVLGPAHPIIGGVLEQEGRVALDRGQRAEAITLLTRAVEILKDSDNVRAYGWPLHDLARLDLEGEAWEAARAKTDELLAAIDPDDPGQAALWANVRALDGDVLARTGDRAAAQRAYDEALTYLEGKVGREHGDTAELLGKIGAGLRELGEPALAVEHLRRALTLEQKIRGERSPTYAKALRRLAEAERDAGSLDDALAHAHAARALLKATVGIDAPEYRRAAQTYTQINMIRARAAKRSRVYHAEAATAARPP